jgi:hypothetical protein
MDYKRTFITMVTHQSNRRKVIGIRAQVGSFFFVLFARCHSLWM